MDYVYGDNHVLNYIAQGEIEVPIEAIPVEIRNMLIGISRKKPITMVFRNVRISEITIDDAGGAREVSQLKFSTTKIEMEVER